MDALSLITRGYVTQQGGGGAGDIIYIDGSKVEATADDIVAGKCPDDEIMLEATSEITVEVMFDTEIIVEGDDEP